MNKVDVINRSPDHLIFGDGSRRVQLRLGVTTGVDLDELNAVMSTFERQHFQELTKNGLLEVRDSTGSLKELLHLEDVAEKERQNPDLKKRTAKRKAKIKQELLGDPEAGSKAIREQVAAYEAFGKAPGEAIELIAKESGLTVEEVVRLYQHGQGQAEGN